MPDLNDYGSLYAQLGRLLETAPGLAAEEDAARRAVIRKAPETQLWIGRAAYLVEQVGIGADAAAFRVQSDNLNTSTQARWGVMMTILYRAFAHCEARVPAAVAGRFVPVGSAFDAFAAIGRIFGAATRDVLVVDPYLDEAVLVDFAMTVPAGVPLRLLADAATVKASLTPAVQRWKTQHATSRPLDARLAPAKTLHDRAIFVDGNAAWTLTQSLKDFAKRSPAEIVRADDTAALKIAAYEAIWAAATPIP